MKSYLNSWKAFAGSFTAGLYQSAINWNLPVRFVAGILITALLMPLIFFGGFSRISAQVQPSSLKMNVPAPVSAPPQAFQISSSDTISAKRCLFSKSVKNNAKALSC